MKKEYKFIIETFDVDENSEIIESIINRVSLRNKKRELINHNNNCVKNAMFHILKKLSVEINEVIKPLGLVTTMKKSFVGGKGIIHEMVIGDTFYGIGFRIICSFQYHSDIMLNEYSFKPSIQMYKLNKHHYSNDRDFTGIQDFLKYSEEVLEGLYIKKIEK